MWTFLRRLFGPPPVPSPRLVELANRTDDLDARLDYLAAELRALRGRVTGAERKKESAQDAPGPTIDPSEVSQVGAKSLPSSAHLARRFKVS